MKRPRRDDGETRGAAADERLKVSTPALMLLAPFNQPASKSRQVWLIINILNVFIYSCVEMEVCVV